jgi:shikimate dehydrogenase
VLQNGSIRLCTGFFAPAGHGGVMTGPANLPDLPSQRFIAGLLGRDILASSSPWLHETEATAQGVHLSYLLFDFAQNGWDQADLPRTLAAAAALGFAGLNVTHPFKQSVMEHLDALSPGAAQVGAVNTISFAAGKMTGYNTDVIGFEESVRRGLPGASLDHVVQYGAGGGGAATAYALLAMGAKALTLFDSDEARAQALAADLRHAFPGATLEIGANPAGAAASATGFVNATPIGMENYPGSAVPIDLLQSNQWVADIVYFPLETLLLREARARGCPTLDGIGMVVFQAAAAFEIFTGLKADRGRMLNSFVKSIHDPVARAA